MAPIEVLIADDHALIREGTRQILAREPDFEVIAEASSGEQAVALMAQHQPVLAVVDLRLPDLSGIEIARQARARGLSTKVVLLSAFDDEEYVMEALSAGAAGYLVKTMPSSELASWLRKVNQGEQALPPALAQRLAERIRHPLPEPALSRREGDVLNLLAAGLSNKEISAQLFISIRTVEGHLGHIFDKLEVGSRTEAVLYALNHRLINQVDAHS
ncbi:MAG: response regulator [Candidatus Dormibacteraceae bacterium]